MGSFSWTSALAAYCPANPDGSDLKSIINEGRKLPDGLVLDVAAGHIYWTNVGDSRRNDGSIMRLDLNGRNMITILDIDGYIRRLEGTSHQPET
ncbi:MAG: hypothetical protein WAM39_04580 [Bryobacteraceae bacterium]